MVHVLMGFISGFIVTYSVLRIRMLKKEVKKLKELAAYRNINNEPLIIKPKLFVIKGARDK